MRRMEDVRWQIFLNSAWSFGHSYLMWGAIVISLVGHHDRGDADAGLYAPMSQGSARHKPPVQNEHHFRPADFYSASCGTPSGHLVDPHQLERDLSAPRTKGQAAFDVVVRVV